MNTLIYNLLRLQRIAKNEYMSFFIVMLLSFPISANAQFRYDNVTSNVIQNVSNSSVEFGDLNNDNLQDLVLIGRTSNATQSVITKIYLGTSTAGSALLEEVPVSLPNVADGDVSLFDFNNDGLLDIFLTGIQDSNKGPLSKLFKNNFNQGTGLSFEEVPAPFVQVSLSSSAWGDVDNDGLQDLLLSGIGADSNAYTQLYKNNYTNTSVSFELFQIVSLPNIYNGSVSFADFNKDGLLDIALSGTQQNGAAITDVFKNEGAIANAISGGISIAFTSINIMYGDVIIIPDNDGYVAWGDYNVDSNLDLLVVGQSGVRVYYNNNDNAAGDPFISYPPLQGVKKGSGKWGDFNNDNLLDFIYCGDAGSILSSPITKIYTFNSANSQFIPLNDTVIGVTNGDVGIADINNDNLLDFILVGQKNAGNASELYVFDTVQFPTANEPPFPPDFFDEQVKDNSVILNWAYTAKFQQFPDNVTYNVFLSKFPFGSDVVSSLSFVPDGKRLITSNGNAGVNQFLRINNLMPGKYYWGIQALDNSFAGSAFSVDSFVIGKNSIAGINYYDFNGNGIKETDELGLFNWQMHLNKIDNSSSTTINTETHTDINGNFNFNFLPPGNYILSEKDSSFAGWTNSEPPQGIYAIEILDVSNDKNTGFNFGNYKNNTISGSVYADANGNGIRDENESGINRFNIILDKLDAPSINGIDTIRTNFSGQYIFGFGNYQLVNGMYRVRLHKRNGFISTFPSNGIYDSVFQNPDIPNR